jgi:hypothetical protein
MVWVGLGRGGKRRACAFKTFVSERYLAPAMPIPRMTTRRWMGVVAVAAILFAVMSRLRCDRSRHPYYSANKAATERRTEKWARQKVASARATAGAFHRTASVAAAEDRDRFEAEAKRYEEEARLWEEQADAASRTAMEYFETSKKSGYRPSELPEHIRREMKPEDMGSPR